MRIFLTKFSLVSSVCFFFILLRSYFLFSFYSLFFLKKCLDALLMCFLICSPNCVFFFTLVSFPLLFSSTVRLYFLSLIISCRYFFLIFIYCSNTIFIPLTFFRSSLHYSFIFPSQLILLLLFKISFTWLHSYLFYFLLHYSFLLFFFILMFYSFPSSLFKFIIFFAC